MLIIAWVGGGLSALGLIGVLWCIRKAMWLRSAELDDDTARSELNKLSFGHMASIGGAFLGLGLLFVGLMLG